ncbi:MULTISPECIES: hypothetical protein [unclassified Microcoleus]
MKARKELVLGVEGRRKGREVDRATGFMRGQKPGFCEIMRC